MKLRVKEPIRNERGEVVGSGNYGMYGAGEVFELPEDEAQRELAVCGHAIEPLQAWQQRQLIEQVKHVYTRQQADDMARHQAELRQMSLAEADLRKQATAKRLHLPESGLPEAGIADLGGSDGKAAPFPLDEEKEALQKRMDEKDRTIAALKAQVEAIEKAPSKTHKKKEAPKPEFTPDEERS